MKVGLVTYALMIGGIERMILNQAIFFSKNGYEVEIIETQWSGLWVGEFRRQGFTVSQVLPRPYESRIRHAKRIAEKLKTFDLLFLTDVPYVKAILGLLPKQTLVFPIIQGNVDSMLSNAASNESEVDEVIVVSPLIQERMVAEGYLSLEKLTVIPNCVQIPSLQVDRSKRSTRRFIFLGRLYHTDKAVLDIPYFMKKVLEQEDFDYLHIYGEGPDRENLKALIQKLGLQDKLVLKGTIQPDEVYKTMEEYDYLLLPSYIEGHPLVLLEGMATGLIPFASLLPNQTDIVVDQGVNGYLAKPGDIDGFADIITKGLKSGDQQRLSANAIITIQRNFSVDVVMQRYMELVLKHKNKSDPRKSRSGKIQRELLGDLPGIPVILVRPVRKMLKLLGLWH
jgi:glycosyltransferase involved in cell wall biosynthesis